MSQAAVVSKVALKDDWSIECANAAQYEGMKGLLLLLGYTFEQHDRYSDDYSTICSDCNGGGGVTQGTTPDMFHFATVIDFLVFHYEAEGEVSVALGAVREKLAAIEELLAA